MGRLKEELEKKFPGKIPASLQRLFKGTQLLPSSMTLEEASEVGCREISRELMTIVIDFLKTVSS